MPKEKFGYPVMSINPRAILRLRILNENNRVIYQLPDDFVDKYLCKIVDKVIEVIRDPDYKHEPEEATHVITGDFFVSFKPEVLEFLRLHQLELIYPLMMQACTTSLTRNAHDVEMCDIQPIIATKYKVWIKGSSVEYFVQNRARPRRVNTQRWVRSRIMIHSKVRNLDAPPLILNLTNCN